MGASAREPVTIVHVREHGSAQFAKTGGKIDGPSRSVRIAEHDEVGLERKPSLDLSHQSFAAVGLAPVRIAERPYAVPPTRTLAAHALGPPAVASRPPCNDSDVPSVEQERSRLPLECDTGSILKTGIVEQEDLEPGPSQSPHVHVGRMLHLKWAGGTERSALAAARHTNEKDLRISAIPLQLSIVRTGCCISAHDDHQIDGRDDPQIVVRLLWARA